MQAEVLDRIVDEDNVESEKLIEIIKNSSVFFDAMKDVKEKFFVNDIIHGVTHNERVSMLACYIGTKEGLTEQELRLVLEAAKYHDIGRGYEGNHGLYSAILLDRNKEYFFPNFKDEDINIIKALCHGHSVDDIKYEDVARLYSIEDIERFKKLLDVVKDADALDRVRLPRFGKLDEKFLRTETSKGMRIMAEKLFSVYKSYKQKAMDNYFNPVSNYSFSKELKKHLLFDGKNYYLLRSLNKLDVRNLDEGNGIIPKVESSNGHSVLDVLSQVKMQHKNTNMISMSEDPNVVLTYDKKSLQRFVLVRFFREEIENSEKLFSAGEYLLGVMDSEVEKIRVDAPKKVNDVLNDIDNASSLDEIFKVLARDELRISKSLLESEQQSISKEEQLIQSKVIAKCKILNYYGLMRGIVYNDERKLIDISSFSQIMRLGFSSSEWLHVGAISNDRVLNVSQELINVLALLKQAEFQGKDKEALNRIEQEVIRLINLGEGIGIDDFQLKYSNYDTLKNDLSIDKAFDLTSGEISYRDTNMQQIAIRTIAEMTLNKRRIINSLQQRLPDINVSELFSDTYCINNDMVTRQNNRGNQIGRNVSFLISDYGYDFDNDISLQILEKVESLSDEELRNIIVQGIDAKEFPKLLVKTRDKEDRIELSKNKGKNSRYIAEAIVEGYNWKKDSNSLTIKEKELLANALLRGVKKNDEIYRLYSAINKIQIGKSKFTQNEAFAIMINIAIDGKIADVAYSELLKKDLREIQTILLDNKDELQTSVLPISIDMLAGRGRIIDKVTQGLLKIGVNKEFVNSRDVKNLYIANIIVENYDFGRDISDREKVALINSLLKNALFNKERSEAKLVKVVQTLQELGLDEQEMYGFILNCSINGFDQINYGDLIRYSKETLKNTFFKDVDIDDMKTTLTEIDMLKAVSDNLTEEEIEQINVKRKELGLDELFDPPIIEKNVYVAYEIVEKYFAKNSEVEINDDEKNSIVKNILFHQALQEKRGGYLLTSLMQYVESLGFKEEQVCGIVINLAVNGSVLEDIPGMDYKRLLQNNGNTRELFAQNKDKVQYEVKKSTILKARIQGFSDEEKGRVLREYDVIGDNEIVVFSNVYTIIELINDFSKRRRLDDKDKDLLLKAILSGKEVKENSLIINTLQRLENNAFLFEEAEEIIIKLAVENKICDLRGYTFRDILGKKDKAKQIFEKRKKFDLKVDEKTFIHARQKILRNEKSGETSDIDIKEEFSKLGIDSEFLDQIHEKNLVTAKEIVDNYKFNRELKDSEKAAIIKNILSYDGAGKTGTRYLENLVKTLELINFSKNEIYGIIINYSVPKSSIEKGVSLKELRNKKKNAIKRLEEMKCNGEEVKTEVDEKTIRLMSFDFENEYGLFVDDKNKDEVYGNARQELIELGIEEEFLKDVHPQNIFVGKMLVEGCNYKEPISLEQKKELVKCILKDSSFSVKKPCYYLYSVIKELATEGLEKSDVYGFLLKTFIEGKVEDYFYVKNVITQPKRLVEYVRKNRESINGEITPDLVEKVMKKANIKLTGKDIAKATMEFAAKGSGGSKVCDDVQEDYIRLLSEKRREEQKGDEQVV